MKARLEKRHDTSWTIVLDFGVVDGKRKRKAVAVKGKKPEAEKEMRRLIAEYEKGIDISDTNKLTFKDFIVRWLKEYAEKKVSPNTYEEYSRVSNDYIIPFLGNKLIAKLTPSDVSSYYNYLLDEVELSPVTIKYHHSLVSIILKTAMKWELISRNVAALTDVPKKDYKEMIVLDENQVNILLENLKDTKHYVLVYLALATGMRRSELLGLHWKKVDFDNKTIIIDKSLIHTTKDGFIFKEPKTKSSRRKIDIGDSIIKVLKNHKLEQTKQKLKLGEEYKDDDLVFCHENGQPIQPKTIGSWWFGISKRYGKLESFGLPIIRFHDLRHTHASLLLKQGVNVKIISERLGHSSVSITLDVYSHLLPSMQKDAISEFDNIFNQ